MDNTNISKKLKLFLIIYALAWGSSGMIAEVYYEHLPSFFFNKTFTLTASMSDNEVDMSAIKNVLLMYETELNTLHIASIVNMTAFIILSIFIIKIIKLGEDVSSSNANK